MKLDIEVIHPIMVHFPIALFCFEFFLLILWRVKSKAEYQTGAHAAFLTAYAMLLAALVTGFRDAGGTIPDLFRGHVKPHFLSAAVLFAIVTVRLILSRGMKRGAVGHGFVQIAGSAVTVMAVLVTGYWGGELVYH